MLKKSFLFFALLVALIFLSITLLLYSNNNKKITEVSTYAENILFLETKKLEFTLDEVIKDLNYLTDKYSDYNPDDNLNDFLKFSANKKKYDQIRFIDNMGMEQFRIDFSNAEAIAISKDRLQNKKNRYYFEDTFKLEKNNIYISPLDLNMEYGSVQVPIKPTLRFAKPVFNTNNEKIGILVLNYLADEVLDRLRIIRNDFFGELSLLNSEGYYFINKDSSKEWGFMFEDDKNSNFKYQFKKAWENISSKSTGSFKDEQGIYYFRTINLTQKLNTDNKIICDDSVWKVVLFVPNQYFEDKTFEDLIKYLPVTSVITIVLSILIWVLLINQRKRDEQITNERDIFVDGTTIVFKLKNAYGWPVEYVSKNVKNILGYDLNDFSSGKLDYANIILPEYIDKFSESVAIAKKNNSKWFEHEPYQVVSKDSKHIWVSNSVSLIKDENGNVTHLYGYIRDITDLKNAQKKITTDILKPL